MGNKLINNSKNKYGTIDIKLNKPIYEAGEQVNGTVFLNLDLDFPNNKLLLKIKGKETFKYYGNAKFLGGDTIVYYNDNKKILNHIFPLHISKDKFIPSGKYEFPFSFILPINSPNNFNYFFNENKISKIFYEINAGFFNPENNELFNKKISVNVWNKSKIRKSNSYSFNENIKVSSCCTRDIGNLNFSWYSDKNLYYFGEKLDLNLEIDLSKFNKDIKYIDLKLIRKIETNSFKTPNQNIEDIIITKQFNNILKKGNKYLFNSEIDDNFSFNLNFNNNLNTTNGQYISCNYYIWIDLITDIKLLKPLISISFQIYNKNISFNNKEELSYLKDWVPEVKEIYICSFTSEYYFKKDDLLKNYDSYFNNLIHNYYNDKVSKNRNNEDNFKSLYN